MENCKTTLLGCLLAASLSLDHVPGIPVWLASTNRILQPMLVAALGYVAHDAPGAPPDVKRIACLAGLGVLLVGMSACRMTGFTLGVTGTPFGSLQVGCDGGVIGHPGGRSAASETNRNVNAGLVATNLVR